MTIRYAPEFERRFLNLPPEIRRKAERRENLFRQNPFHPSLETEKLKPKEKEYWSFRIDRTYRIIFRFSGMDEITLITCGHHKWIYRYLIAH